MTNEEQYDTYAGYQGRVEALVKKYSDRQFKEHLDSIYKQYMRIHASMYDDYSDLFLKQLQALSAYLETPSNETLQTLLQETKKFEHIKTSKGFLMCGTAFAIFGIMALIGMITIIPGIVFLSLGILGAIIGAIPYKYHSTFAKDMLAVTEKITQTSQATKNPSLNSPSCIQRPRSHSYPGLSIFKRQLSQTSEENVSLKQTKKLAVSTP